MRETGETGATNTRHRGCRDWCHEHAHSCHEHISLMPLTHNIDIEARDTDATHKHIDVEA
jgi:hypothetical protein